MILTLKSDSKKQDIDKLTAKIKELGFTPHISRGAVRLIIGVIGEGEHKYKEVFESFDIVESATPIVKPYKLVSREFKKEDSIIDVNGVKIGGHRVVVMAGPCSVDTKENLFACARAVQRAGAHFLRGGAFKPRTSPYSFQGHGVTALKYLAEARKLTSLPVVTEVMDTRQVEVVARYADILQVGARNSQNFDLLKEIGQCKKPVMLKRGMANTIEEWLMSAEYIVSKGNRNVILCERGIRTFEPSTRFTIDLNAIPVIKHLTHLPILVDPSHGVGVRDYIPPIALAAIAAGADGVMVEVHPKPTEALSDGMQALLPVMFDKMMEDIRKVAEAVGKTL
ncbi:MAG: 3-deoxy-7-phosphoheptulonate synthase [Elusimicrobia bacterium]|nr:3-deoxy-7-phosphoheptulonate synthase [Elusimicrobiota bacterium]MBI4218246.1 3-deoxy-7-phosphoheptulonate synthase [Elusimicrobiota bacterium]